MPRKEQDNYNYLSEFETTVKNLPKLDRRIKSVQKMESGTNETAYRANYESKYEKETTASFAVLYSKDKVHSCGDFILTETIMTLDESGKVINKTKKESSPEPLIYDEIAVIKPLLSDVKKLPKDKVSKWLGWYDQWIESQSGEGRIEGRFELNYIEEIDSVVLISEGEADIYIPGGLTEDLKETIEELFQILPTVLQKRRELLGK